MIPTQRPVHAVELETRVEERLEWLVGAAGGNALGARNSFRLLVDFAKIETALAEAGKVIVRAAEYVAQWPEERVANYTATWPKELDHVTALNAIGEVTRTWLDQQRGEHA